MFPVKLLSCVVLIVGVYGRSIVTEEHQPWYYVMPDTYFDEPSPILVDEEYMHPIRAARERRQLHGSFAYNPDSSSSLNMKFPLGGNDKNMFSAIGGLDFTRNKQIAAGTAGLAYENIRGHGLSLTQTHMPGVGDRSAAAGTLNLFHNDNHNLAANAFAARTTLNNPAVPSFNNVGGGLDYMFKNKVSKNLFLTNKSM